MIEAETNESLIERDDDAQSQQQRNPQNPVPIALWFVLFASCITAVSLITKWIVSFMGDENQSGMSTSSIHFFWMILFVVLTALGTLSFRLFTGTSRLVAKVVHAMSLTGAFIIAAFGLNAKWKGLGQLYSLHSWLGFIFVVIFGIQWFIGILSFLLSLVPPSTRAKLIPYHRTMGTIITISIAAIAVIGINEKMIFNKEYKQLNADTMLGNFAGLATMIVGLVAIYIQIKPEYKRVEQRRPRFELVEME